MSGENLFSRELIQFPLWKKAETRRTPLMFDLELTARCNNNCRHCYINLPENDADEKKQELTLAEIKDLVDQAVDLGALWCLLTGGEPLLREDFSEIYMYLKKKGLLISLFTNGTLINESHINLFKKFPPRNIEITVYGVTETVYQQVTGKHTYQQFINGLDLLKTNNIKVGLKAVPIRSNLEEISEIFRFCKENSDTVFRFDPFLHLRYDRNEGRNRMIKRERLSVEEIFKLEREDATRFQAVKEMCEKVYNPTENGPPYLFMCAAGINSFAIGSKGIFRMCATLCHPDCQFDLRKMSIKDVWVNHVPNILNMRSDSHEFKEKCATCELINLCMWCPAITYLETGYMDTCVEEFCEMAKSRNEMTK